MAEQPDKDGLTPLASSVVQAYGYNPDTRELRIKFPNGDVHQYEDVPVDKVETMIGSSSPGAFFTSRIKGVHLSKKVSP